MRLAIENLTAGYASGFCIRDISMVVEPGEILGIIGPNGAGKTTLLRALTRVIPPLHGRILLEGHNVRHLPAGEMARRVAVVSQTVPAVDLDVEVAPRFEPRPEELVSVKLVKGTLVVSRKLARRKAFEVKNSGREAVKILVEHPLEPGWKLVEPAEPAEKTRDRYRFAVEAEPGKPATLVVAEEQVVAQRLAVTNLDDNAILVYSTAKVTSPAVKQALQDVLKRKQEIARIARERSRREQEIKAVGQEQERIRQNMAQLDRTSDLYTRYVQKFAVQEDRVPQTCHPDTSPAHVNRRTILGHAAVEVPQQQHLDAAVAIKVETPH